MKKMFKIPKGRTRKSTADFQKESYPHPPILSRCPFYRRTLCTAIADAVLGRERASYLLLLPYAMCTQLQRRLLLQRAVVQPKVRRNPFANPYNAENRRVPGSLIVSSPYQLIL